MSYTIYTTSGIVLNGKDYGEADRLCRIFTRDIGVIMAVIKGVRKQSAKLSAHLKDFSAPIFSLVKGDPMWRIITVDSGIIWRKIFENKESRKIYIRIMRLLEKLLQGEEANLHLFDILISGFNKLDIMCCDKLYEKDLAIIEMLLVWRILHILGYVKYDHNILSGVEISDKQIEYLKQNKPKIIVEINKALEASHLM